MSLSGINRSNPIPFQTSQQRFSGNNNQSTSRHQDLTTRQLLILYGTSGYAALSGLDEATILKYGSSVGQQFPEHEAQLRQKLSS